MGSPYTEVTIANYNTDPPTDDGANTAANEVEWAKHKTKLGDPLKTGHESTQTNITAAFAKRYGNDVFSIGTSHTVTLAQEGRMLEGTATITFTLPASATAGTGFLVGFANTGTGTVTVDGESTETINGSETVALTAQEFMWVSSDGTNWTILSRGALEGFPLTRGHIDGLITSRASATQLSIAAGSARDDGDAANMVLSSALAKNINASWAVGDNQGGLDGTESSAGTPDNSTWYHVWLIRRSDTGVVDALFSESATAPTLPTDYDQQRRIGAVLTDGSGNITDFFQHSDQFFWVSRVNAFSASSTGTAAVSRTIRVPTGLEVIAQLSFMHLDDSAGTANLALVSSLDSTDQVPSTAAFTTQIRSNGGTAESNAAEVFVKTNTSGQIRTRNTQSQADITIVGSVVGWIDPRGTNA